MPKLNVREGQEVSALGSCGRLGVRVHALALFIHLGQLPGGLRVAARPVEERA